MVQVLQCYPTSPPTGPVSGLESPRYTANWYVEVDEVTAGDHVRQLAEAVSTQAHRNRVPLPTFGDSLAFNGYTDKSVFALEYSPTLLFPEAADSMTDWNIEVTWRQLDPRRDEDPATLEQPPLEREPLYFIEYNQEYATTDTAYKVTNRKTFELASTRDADFGVDDLDPATLIANSLGEKSEPLPITRLRPVLVAAKNVKTPVDALTRNETFENTVNGSNFTFTFKDPGESPKTKLIKKHHARFMRADLSSRRQWRNQYYYRMFTRIEISRSPYYDLRMNEGEVYLLTPGGQRWRGADENGNTIPGPYPMKADSTLAKTPAEQAKNWWLKYGLKDFTALL